MHGNRDITCIHARRSRGKDSGPRSRWARGILAAFEKDSSWCYMRLCIGISRELGGKRTGGQTGGVQGGWRRLVEIFLSSPPVERLWGFYARREGGWIALPADLRARASWVRVRGGLWEARKRAWRENQYPYFVLGSSSEPSQSLIRQAAHSRGPSCQRT